MSELLPCPFCGGAVEGEWDGPTSDDAYRIRCRSATGCGVEVLRYGLEEDATAAWNRRTPPAEVAALRARVAELEAACRRVLDAVEDGDEMDAVAMCRAALHPEPEAGR